MRSNAAQMWASEKLSPNKYLADCKKNSEIITHRCGQKNGRNAVATNHKNAVETIVEMRSKQLQSWEHRLFATFPTICSFWCWDFDKEDNIKLFISLSLSLKFKKNQTTTYILDLACVSLGCWLYHLPKGRIIVRFREFQRVALMAAAVGGRGRSLNDQENYHVDGLALLGRPPEWTGRWSLGGFQLMGAQKLSKAEMSFWFSWRACWGDGVGIVVFLDDDDDDGLGKDDDDDDDDEVHSGWTNDGTKGLKSQSVQQQMLEPLNVRSLCVMYIWYIWYGMVW